MNTSEISFASVSIGTAATWTEHGSRGVATALPRIEKYRGSRLLEGRFRKYTLWYLLLPWKMWWQCLLNATIIYKFVVRFLITYCYSRMSLPYLEYSLYLMDVIFVVDLFNHFLHAYWSAVRLHIRVYRRNHALMFWDVISCAPLCLLLMAIYGDQHPYYVTGRVFGQWLGLTRIYRLYNFFCNINGSMRSSRTLLYVAEHMILVILVLHATTCIWYHLHSQGLNDKPWYNMGYPEHVNSEKLRFNTYLHCWYYCACRFFNIILGDGYPLDTSSKIMTGMLMISGYALMRYRFIGYLAWELSVRNHRWSTFVDRYHHLLNYLKFCGAPSWLVEQSKHYKLSLWQMKDGILRSNHLRELPHPLQMELIFDINVGHFQNTLLFRDADEAFLRHISLIMRHEIFLEGQQVWSQGVVKSGMLCVKRGVIEMLSDEDDESPMIAFTEGTVLGELSLFYSIPSKVTVKAATYVELQILRRTDFMRAMGENPVALNAVREIINKRLKSVKRRQQAIEAYDRGDSRLIRTRYRPMKVLKDNLNGIEDEDSTFVDDSHMFYKDGDNERHPKFTAEYLQLYRVCPNVTTVETPHICLKDNFPWILEPNTGFTHLFDIVHFLLVLYVCIMAPLDTVAYTQSEFARAMGLIVMAGLMFNIYLQLTTCIIEKDVKKDTVREIAEAKLASVGFYLDVISVFPIYIFSHALDPNGDTAWREVVKLIPCLQVWHIWSYMNKWEKNVYSNPKFLCLCKYALMVLIFCYWSGCFLLLYSCPKNLCKERSWMSQLIFWETKVFKTHIGRHENRLAAALALGTAMFTVSGTVVIVPGVSDLIIIVLLFIAGTYVSCFYIAEICGLYLLATKRKIKFMQTMRELFYFLSVNRVSSKIKARVYKFFCVQWYYNNAVSADEVFYDVSSSIQQEVLSIEMVETMLYCPLFQECSRDFLQTVAASTRTIILPDDEVVQHGADISRDMYILQKGHCNILNHLGKVIKTSGPGSHFGVVEMLFGLPKVHTVVTSTNCILRHIEYTALVQCWSTFPEISHPISTAIQSEELQKMSKQFEDGKPLTGRLDTKMNRIAQELKESFIVLSSHKERKHYIQEFDKLGCVRYIRYIFLAGCITPHGMFLKSWCFLRSVVAMYYIIIIPYNLAIKQHMDSSAAHSWMDLFLYIDIIVMSYVSYYNENNLLITHPLLTVSRYLKTTFIWDCISVFPFERLFQLINHKINQDLCRINRLLLVSRITGSFDYWQGDIMRVNQLAVLLKFLPGCIVMVNLTASFIFMNACVPILPRSPLSSTAYVNCTRGSITATMTGHDVIWAVEEYLRTMMWTFEIFLGLGCTPAALVSRLDLVLVMGLQVLGYLYFAFMFGYVASTRTAVAQTLLEHTENIRDLENFLYQENVDEALTAKTLKYFEYIWKKTNGSNPQKICRSLNSALMEDTLVFMYEHALREVPLFGKVERSFIRVITKHLNEMYFLRGDTVVQCKDMQSQIYIIYRGKVDVLSSYNEMVTCMGPGGMFGNFAGLPVSCSEVTIVASRSLDLLVIPSATFVSLVKYYPKLQEPLKKAFEMSKDYILPITMDIYMEESSSDSSQSGSEADSGHDSRSGISHLYDLKAQMSLSNSHSNVSQAKSQGSISTFQSYTNVSNILRPGSFMFQGFGYISCIMASLNYISVLYEITTLNDCMWLFWIQTIFDVFFYMKLFISIHQGYVNKSGNYVTDSTKCRSSYFRKKLRVWTDVVVILPLELFGFCFQ